MSIKEKLEVLRKDREDFYKRVVFTEMNAICEYVVLNKDSISLEDYENCRNRIKDLYEMGMLTSPSNEVEIVEEYDRILHKLFEIGTDVLLNSKLV